MRGISPEALVGGGVKFVSLQHWPIQFGAASGVLRLMVANFLNRITNGQPPWFAYCAVMSSTLIALDKHPGVRLVRVGETWC